MLDVMTRSALLLGLMLSLSAQAATPDQSAAGTLKPKLAAASLPKVLLHKTLPPKGALVKASAPISPTLAPHSGVPVLLPKVVARYPHDRAAFTEGLELVGTVLFESTGLVGESSIRRVNLQSGKVTQRRTPPSRKVFSEGLTVLDTVAYQLTWQDGLVYLYDPQTLRSLGQLRYQGEGWGLTNDGKQLIMSDGSDLLYWRDSRSFAITKKLRVTAAGTSVTNLNELEYINGSIYANVWLSNKIARVDAETGKVTAWIDVSNLAREAGVVAEKNGQGLGFDDVPNGIAFNALKGTLLLTGKRWPLMFEVKLP